MISDNHKPYTLVTGAAIGIGRALAIECARRNMNLALIDLPGSGLGKTIHHLKNNFQVDVQHLETDLTSPNSAEKIFNWSRKQNITVGMLINNAGKGYLGEFTDYDHAFYEKMVRLNIESVVVLTRLFLPEMKKLDRAYILNLGSLAAFYPIPYKIVYAGSKSFIYSFSRALKQELKHSRVTVSVLCPGPIITNQEVIMRIRQGGFWAKNSSMQPSKMAGIAMSQLLRGKPLIIPGLLNKCFRIASMLVPTKIKQAFLSRKFYVNKKM